MRKLILLASAAAMAASLPALAQAKNGGQGKGGGNPHAAERNQGGGNEARGGGRDRGPQAGKQGGSRAESSGNGRGNRQARQVERQIERRVERGVERDVRRIEQRDVRLGDGGDFRAFRDQRRLPVRAAAQGRNCPPGLAKKNAFCMPPGQLRRAQMMGQRVDAGRFAAVPQEWQYRFRDDSDYLYRYDASGLVYRIGRGDNLISSIVPLFGRGLSVGEPLPLGYDVYNVPYQYRDDYVDGSDYLYRYDDNAIYRVNQQSNLIESVVALLGGNGLNVGQRAPDGYDVYNLPENYRGEYADDADSMFRYSNGGIYQIDPTTMLVQALVEMIS